MKVKYIAEPYGHDEFEKEINDFIKDKKIIDIKLSAGSDALVMYEEPNILQQKTFDEFSEDDEVNEFLKSHDVIQVDHLPDCYTVVTYRKSVNNG